ncbi:MAG: DUF6036 family nucleotidyltransferase [Chloroflexota bacterium]
MNGLSRTQIQQFLIEVGNRHEQPSTLVLLGGAALCLLGNPRPTEDIDYVGDDLSKSLLQHTIEQVANDMDLAVEPVPIHEFVPMPQSPDDNHIYIGQFSHLNVYIIDPYTIALSKIDRGFETDIEDILFLIRNNFITFDQLVRVVDSSFLQADKFDLDISAMKMNLAEVQKSLQDIKR